MAFLKSQTHTSEKAPLAAVGELQHALAPRECRRPPKEQKKRHSAAKMRKRQKTEKSPLDRT